MVSSAFGVTFRTDPDNTSSALVVQKDNDDNGGGHSSNNSPRVHWASSLATSAPLANNGGMMAPSVGQSFPTFNLGTKNDEMNGQNPHGRSNTRVHWGSPSHSSSSAPPTSLVSTTTSPAFHHNEPLHQPSILRHRHVNGSGIHNRRPPPPKMSRSLNGRRGGVGWMDKSYKSQSPFGNGGASAAPTHNEVGLFS